VPWTSWRHATSIERDREQPARSAQDERPAEGAWSPRRCSRICCTPKRRRWSAGARAAQQNKHAYEPGRAAAAGEPREMSNQWAMPAWPTAVVAQLSPSSGRSVHHRASARSPWTPTSRSGRTTIWITAADLSVLAADLYRHIAVPGAVHPADLNTTASCTPGQRRPTARPSQDTTLVAEEAVYTYVVALQEA